MGRSGRGPGVERTVCARWRAAALVTVVLATSIALSGCRSGTAEVVCDAQLVPVGTEAEQPGTTDGLAYSDAGCAHPAQTGFGISLLPRDGSGADGPPQTRSGAYEFELGVPDQVSVGGVSIRFGDGGVSFCDDTSCGGLTVGGAGSE